jgi:hypothetical protein
MANDILVTHDFAVPAERVFAALDDHASMGRWMGGKITLAKRSADGGVGTVRRIHLGVTAIDEEIVERQVPARIVYRIVAGVPFLKHHRGEVHVESRGPTSSQVRWHVDFQSRLPGVSGVLLPGLGAALKQGLKRLERQLRA